MRRFGQTSNMGVSAKSKTGLANYPWKTFDPEKRCRVHDELNDQMIEWRPRCATLYQEYAVEQDEWVIAWGGLLLDGWTEVASGHRTGGE